MSYEWTPISEPPDSIRDICIWYKSTKTFYKGYYENKRYYHEDGMEAYMLTHWKDIKPPTK